MASTTIPKQLGELLQEQQEPFVLEVYLLERGYVGRNFNSQRSFRCFCSNSSIFFKWSASWDQSKRKRVIPNCSKVVKLLVTKLLSKSTTNQKGKNPSVQEIVKRNQETAESDRFSSASSKTVFDRSFSQSDTEDGPNPLRRESISSSLADTCLALKLRNLLQEEEVITDRKLQWRCREDNKKLSPVSVLEGIPSSEDSPVHEDGQQNAKTRDSIFAAPFCNFIAQTPMDERNCGTGPSAAKRVMQQSKQLLSDWVRKSWSELLSGKVTHTNQHLNSDFAASVAEWRDLDAEVKEIGVEMGDAILADINKETVEEMIELFRQHFSHLGKMG